jgi:hypothetical protein
LIIFIVVIIIIIIIIITTTTITPLSTLPVQVSMCQYKVLLMASSRPFLCLLIFHSSVPESVSVHLAKYIRQYAPKIEISL